MKRGLANFRTYYFNTLDDRAFRYLNNQGVPVKDDEDQKRYDDHYNMIHGASVLTGVAAGFAWGFSEDQGDDSFLSIVGAIGGFAVATFLLPACFMYPTFARIVGVVCVAKVAARARYEWRKRKD
jgi:hypothetical protein